MQIRRCFSVMFGAALLMAGCQSGEAEKTAPAQPEKVTIHLEANAVSDTPEVSVDPTAGDPSAEAAAKRDARQRQEFLEQERRKAEKAQQKQDRMEGGFVGDLNDTERAYLEQVREKNRRSKEASHSKVFGGFLEQ